MSERKRKRPSLDFVPAGRDAVASAQSADPEAILSVGRQASRNGTWVAEDRLDSLLTVPDAAGRTGRSEAELESAIEQGRVLAIDDGAGGRLVPGFQLAGDALASTVAEVNALLAPVCVTTRTVWLWFLSPKDELGGEAPAAWIVQSADHAPVLLAAERDAQRLDS
jgi:hypothetical protein